MLISSQSAFPLSSRSASRKAPRLYEENKGHEVLKLTAATQPALLSDACDEFLSTQAGTPAAQSAINKIMLLQPDLHPNILIRGKTAVTRAIEENRPWLFRTFLKQPGCDPGTPNQNQYPAIDSAIFHDKPEAFQSLLQKMDEKKLSVSDETVDWTADCGQPLMLKTLQEKNPERFPEDEWEELIQIAEQQAGKIRLYKTLSDDEREAVLSRALHNPKSDYERTEIPLALERSGLDLNQTAFVHYAVRDNERDLLQVLIHAGKNLSPALLTSVNYSFSDDQKVSALLNAGADPNFCNEENTPLLNATRYRYNEDAIQLLLKAGADPTHANRKGGTPLLNALEIPCNLRVVKSLLDAGADPKHANRKGETSLLKATAKFYPLFIIKRLLEAGVDPNLPDVKGNTPLLNITKSKDFGDTIKLLLNAGADPKHANQEGETPLLNAISCHCGTDIVNALLNAGADPNQPDQKGDTPLHRAAQERLDNLFDPLLKAGASPDIPNKKGLTPFHTHPG